MPQYLTCNFPAFDSPTPASGKETLLPLLCSLGVEVVLEHCTEWFGEESA